MKFTVVILLLLGSSLCFSQEITPEILLSSADKKTYVCPPCNRRCDDLEFETAGVCEHCNMKLVTQEEIKEWPKNKRMRVGFYLQSGVEILDFAGPMEVFNYSGYDVVTISKNKDQVYAQGILKITPDYDLEDAPTVDVLVFFGGNAILPSKDPKLIRWLRQQENTKYYFSVCSGALILAEAGILDGKQATTFRNTLDVLEQNYPKIDVLRGARYVDNGNVITTAGVSAGIDGALHMVAKLNGLATAGETAFYMEYDWVPDKGVVLSEENPYKDMNNVEILQQYRGVFRSISNEEISIKLNTEQGQLHLFKEGRLFPIFYLEKDRFLTSHSSHIMNFKRNEENIIIGLETSEFKNEFFKK